ncbi:hypothetical protein [Dinghuibacter silviterrae]|uniref:Uncharacterized protein n=1 Tax=Dinghuibacter silviterrae TaxID=1539049 RepID=A0A4R8DPQ8_9BACT|nr:hypothetical protein [Dinghuibacter silviterrae]TDW99735.1 hypothetical protein EDB95_0746 [Dinghuibacter silviterrae]
MDLVSLSISVVIAILSLKDVNFIKHWPFIKNLKPKEAAVAILSVVVLILSYSQGKRNDRLLVHKQAQADSLQHLRDSLFNTHEDSLSKDYGKKVEIETHKNITSFTDALAKYKLHYDSTQKEVVKSLNDSSHKVVSQPFVGLCRATVGNPPPIRLAKENGEDCVEFSVCTFEALARHINLKVYEVPSIGGNLVDPQMHTEMTDDVKGPGTVSTLYFSINLQAFGGSDTIFIYFKGNYQNVEGTRFDIDQMEAFVPFVNDGKPCFPDRKGQVLEYLTEKKLITHK